MDQFTAHLDRGWDLVARGDFAGAMLSAQKSLELDSGSPEAHNLMGYIHAAEGNAEAALEHYRQAINIDEGYIEAMLNAAEVLIHPLHDFDGALEMVEEALDFAQTDDEIADAMLLKVDVLLHKGDQDSAKRVVSTLPEGPFEGQHLDFLIGRAKFEVGDLPGAEPRIREAVSRDPKNGEAQYYLGLLLEAAGDHRGATVAFLTARDLDLALPEPPHAIPRDQFEPRVQAAIRRLPRELALLLEDALVVVSDVPGPEIVAEGVDPRIEVLLDESREPGEAPKTNHAARGVGRVFVYKRNVERAVHDPLALEDEILRSLEHEIRALLDEKSPPDRSTMANESEPQDGTVRSQGDA